MEMSIRTDRMELFKGADSFSNQPHNHRHFYQFTVPVQGICHFTMDNRPFRLHEGDGLVQHPGAEHYLHLDDASSVIIIKFRQDALQLDNGPNTRPEFAERQWMNPLDLSRRFQHWTTELMFTEEKEPLAAQETEIQVLHYLKEALYGSSMFDGKLENRGNHFVRDVHLDRVLEYMHECYSSAVSIEELSAIAGQSRYHFMRMFHAYTGVTPYQYLLRLRIEDARIQLRNSSASIAEISCSLGFSSASQFHRIFLKVVGLTPGEFRRSGR
ncbi:AraC family transcriptional regulator [Paenibacillus dendrobii]|nr:AraC family transcriptional regulator [Paenibacillus dendrobii]